MAVCPKCEGKKAITCPSCNGDGHRYFVPVLDFWESGCSKCYGVGTITCNICEGSGDVFQISTSSAIQTIKETNAYT